MTTTLGSHPVRQPHSVGRSIVSLILCPLLAVLPVSPSLAASAQSAGESRKPSKESTLATFELANVKYHNVTLLIIDGDLVVQHDGGVTRHPLAMMYYKTLLRIGKVMPELREKADYQAALATFVPSLSIAGKTYAGVRLEGLSGDDVSLLTDAGKVSCRLADLSTEARVALDSAGRSLTKIHSEKAARQQRIAESQAAAARSAAAAAEAQQRARANAVAKYRAAVPYTPPPADTDDTGETIGKVLGGAALLGLGAWAVSKLFGGDDASESSQEDDRAVQTRRQLETFMERDRQRAEEQDRQRKNQE